MTKNNYSSLLSKRKKLLKEPKDLNGEKDAAEKTKWDMFLP